MDKKDIQITFNNVETPIIKKVKPAFHNNNSFNKMKKQSLIDFFIQTKPSEEFPTGEDFEKMNTNKVKSKKTQTKTQTKTNSPKRF